MYQILVIEDEVDIQEILRNYLMDRGYGVTLARDGVDGVAKFHDGNFDLVLLDIMLPKIDGFGVCELIRRESDVPIIMLTALEEEAYQIKGFDLKADDYITKPFSMPILLRKIAAILRRSQKEGEQQTLICKNLFMDVTGRRVYLTEGYEASGDKAEYQERTVHREDVRASEAAQGQRKEVELTQKEFELLYVLLINRGIVLTRQRLLNMVWGEDYFGEERIVDTHIKNIRKKIGTDIISTIRGVGYRVDKENKK